MRLVRATLLLLAHALQCADMAIATYALSNFSPAADRNRAASPGALGWSRLCKQKVEGAGVGATDPDPTYK